MALNSSILTQYFFGKEKTLGNELMFRMKTRGKRRLMRFDWLKKL